MEENYQGFRSSICTELKSDGLLFIRSVSDPIKCYKLSYEQKHQRLISTDQSKTLICV